MLVFSQLFDKLSRKQDIHYLLSGRGENTSVNLSTNNIILPHITSLSFPLIMTKIASTHKQYFSFSSYISITHINQQQKISITPFKFH